MRCKFIADHDHIGGGLSPDKLPPSNCDFDNDPSPREPAYRSLSKAENAQYRDPRPSIPALTEDTTQNHPTVLDSTVIDIRQVPGSEQGPLVDRLNTLQVPSGIGISSKIPSAKNGADRSQSVNHAQQIHPLPPETGTSQIDDRETAKQAISISIDPKTAQSDDIVTVISFAKNLIHRAQAMAKEDLHHLAENLRAQESGLEKGAPKAPRIPVWENHGVQRGALIRIPIVQQGCDPNSKEDRRRFVVGTGFVDVCTRLVVVYCVSRIDVIAGIVTTRSGRGAIHLTDRDRKSWGALWEVGNAEMKHQKVGMTFKVKMLDGFRGAIHKGSIFKLHGVPLSLPSDYLIEGYVTKESCKALPLPNGYNKDGWECGYEDVVPQIMLESGHYQDPDQPANKDNVRLSYGDDQTADGSQSSDMGASEDPDRMRPYRSRKRSRSPEANHPNKRPRCRSAHRAPDHCSRRYLQPGIAPQNMPRKVHTHDQETTLRTSGVFKDEDYNHSDTES